MIQPTVRPETGIYPAGTTGDNGWYRSTVTVTLTASDGSGSGVAARYYKIDDGAWNTYDPLNKPVIGDGQHTFYWYAVDNKGNTETVHTKAVNVDMTSSAIQIIVAGSSNSSVSGYRAWYEGVFNIPDAYAQVTDSGSGIALDRAADKRRTMANLHHRHTTRSRNRQR